ncbi:hypothetical protein CRG98_044555 [Punica granatum]|uniref:Uncharacterized protein n=1 Tax=Punica granatum TaxID=22663 RepID=A0A2I0HU73_PUNGR|nr:hypothetical protein CRG98_044555 [Punica granatum]
MAGRGKADYSMGIVDRSQISALPESAPTSAIIPLSFFDIKWLVCSLMQRLFFYDFPNYSVLQFTEHALFPIPEALPLHRPPEFFFSLLLAASSALRHPEILTWSELEGDTTSTCIKNALPFLDRSVIKDPNVLSRASCLRNGGTSSRHGKRRATFTLTRVHIDRLKSWILSKTEDPLLRISTFVATCANILVCLIKSKEIGKTKVLNPDFHHFVFLADCRECLGYPIPNIFFGNCLESCFVSVKREELVGQHGIVSATRALGAKVKELEEEGGLLREPE